MGCDYERLTIITTFLLSSTVNATWMEELSTASNASFSIEGGDVVVERVQAASKGLTGTWDLTIQGATIKGWIFRGLFVIFIGRRVLFVFQHRRVP